MRFLGLAVGAAGALLVAVALNAAAPQGPPEIQLQAAIHKETIEGDLRGAIVELQRIVNTPGVGRGVAARAWLHLGQCHEKLGNTEARRSYEQILREFGDQGEVVREARMRLLGLPKADAKQPEDGRRGRVIIGPSYHARGAISPDGRYLAYCCTVIHDIAADRDRQVPAEISGVPRFSPDSRSLAYVLQHPGERPELHTIGTTGAGDRVLLSDPDVREMSLFDWMPDGKQLLVRLVRADKTTEIALVAVTDGAVSRLWSPAPAFGGTDEGSLSPDGRFFAYRASGSATSSRSTTRILSLDGRVNAVLVARPENAWNAGWTGDGRFAFYSAERGAQGIWTVQVDDGRARGSAERVAVGLDESVRPVGITRGGSFAYHRSILDTQVQLMSLVPGSAPLAPSRVFGASQAPAWSPDGRALAYAQSGTGIVNIFTAATRATRSLWTGLPGPVMALSWLPDSSGLAAQGPGPDDSTASVGLRRVDLVSGALSDIMTGPGWRQFGANASFSAGGKVVTYKTFGAGQVTRLVRRDLESGSEEILLERKPPLYISAFDVRPATGEVAVAFQETEGGSSLGVFDTSSRTFRAVHQTARGDYVPASITVAWTPDGKSLLFVTAPGRTKGIPMSLWKIPASGGTPQKLFEAETILQVRVSPDGSTIALDTRSYRMETRAVDGLFQPMVR